MGTLCFLKNGLFFRWVQNPSLLSIILKGEKNCYTVIVILRIWKFDKMTSGWIIQLLYM
jgi:hypothetical protein